MRKVQRFVNGKTTVNCVSNKTRLRKMLMSPIVIRPNKHKYVTDENYTAVNTRQLRYH